MRLKNKYRKLYRNMCNINNAKTKKPVFDLFFIFFQFRCTMVLLFSRKYNSFGIYMTDVQENEKE